VVPAMLTRVFVVWKVLIKLVNLDALVELDEIRALVEEVARHLEFVRQTSREIAELAFGVVWSHDLDGYAVDLDDRVRSLRLFQMPGHATMLAKTRSGGEGARRFVLAASLLGAGGAGPRTRGTIASGRP